MNIQDKFDLYIDGLLNNKEKSELEDQFLNNPELFSEFKQYVNVNHLLAERFSSTLLNYTNDVILDQLSLGDRLQIEEDVSEYFSDPLKKEEKDFRNLIKPLSKKISKNQGTIKVVLFSPIFKLAASIILILFISIAIVNSIRTNNNQLSASQIFQKYFNPVNDKSFKSQRTYHLIMQKALIDFRKADFAAASSSLDMISMDYDTDYMYHILKGLIYVKQDETDKAKEFFITAMNKANQSNKFIAEWYLSLVYLKKNNTRDALPLLLDLRNNKNPYRWSAKKILRTVKLP